MNVLQRALEWISPGRSTSSRGDIVLGLPLDVGNRAIYPVYLDPGSTSLEGDTAPRQIGYVEIGDGRADFTSLEPDYRWPVIAAATGLSCLVAVWVFRRRRG